MCYVSVRLGSYVTHWYVTDTRAGPPVVGLATPFPGGRSWAAGVSTVGVGGGCVCQAHVRPHAVLGNCRLLFLTVLLFYSTVLLLCSAILVTRSVCGVQRNVEK